MVKVNYKIVSLAKKLRLKELIISITVLQSKVHL